MTAELLSAIAAIVLSLVFSYVPSLNTWYAAKSESFKKLTMLVMIIIVAAGSFGMACAGVIDDIFGMTMQCDKTTALSLVKAFIFALTSNQTIFSVTPQTKAVKEAKEESKMEESKKESG